MELIHIPYFTSLKKEFNETIDRVWISGKRVLVITKNDEVYSIGEILVDDPQGCDHTHEPKAIPQLNGKNVKDFIFGNDIIVALNEDGQLFSWGVNDAGQLGLGNRATTYSPTLISSLSDKKIIKVVIENIPNRVFALSNDGQAMRWGLSWGESPVKGGTVNEKITDIAIANRPLFSQGYRYFCVQDAKIKSITQGTVFMENVSAMVCGLSHMLALKHDGTLYSAGYNEKGQLGIGRIEENLQINFVRVENISEKIIEIASLMYTCAVKTESNRIYVWGACRGQIVTRPFRTSYASFDEVFFYCTEPLTTYGALKLSSIIKSTKNTRCDCSEIIKIMVDFDERSKISDFTIVVQEKEIFVHREILTQRSDYFRTMLKESWSESDKNVMHVKDFTYETFKIYLQYLYGIDIDVTSKNVMELLMIAHRYMDENLEKLIVEKTKDDEFMKMAVDSVKRLLGLPPEIFRMTSSVFKFMYPSQ